MKQVMVAGYSLFERADDLINQQLIPWSVSPQNIKTYILKQVQPLKK